MIGGGNAAPDLLLGLGCALAQVGEDFGRRAIDLFHQRLNLVAGLIRGKRAEDAMNILAFSKKAMAVDARKVLASAIANAENNHNLDVDALVVAEASVGKSITMKRFHTRGRGKSTRILKPFSRLRIVVREVEEA